MTTSGYDPHFLGLDLHFPVASAGTTALPLTYTHFTVLLDPSRRLALATGVNIDGPTLLDLGRGDDWHLDNRIPALEQTGPAVYADNDLDRGHLVRRRDPVWGDPVTAAAANFDTFVFTNAAPQAGDFNQGAQLWLGLEDYVLTHADTFDQRLSVFTAPVLDLDDPTYRGVQIPRRFWKIAAWNAQVDESDPAQLAATGYVLDQTPQLDDLDIVTRRALAAGEAPPLGPYRTFQVPIVDIATLTGLALGPLVEADRHTADADPVNTAGLQRDSASIVGWRPLQSYLNIQLGVSAR